MFLALLIPYFMNESESAQKHIYAREQYIAN